MKKTLIIVGGSIVVLGVLGFAFRNKIKAMIGRGGEKDEDIDEDDEEIESGKLTESDPPENLKGNTKPYEDIIQERIVKINKNPKWLASVKAKAEKEKKPLDVMIRRSAIWWLKNKEKTIPMTYKD